MGLIVSAILLDIEGTTTPIDFVHGTLYTYAASRLDGYLAAHAEDPVLLENIRSLRDEYLRDVAEGNIEDVWAKEDSPRDALFYLHYLISVDRKSAPLKAIQGRIWEAGYQSGELKGEVYPDVPEALVNWFESGKKIAIFSSGSVLAQKLLFKYSTEGDLTPLIDSYFDTRFGPKREPESYRQIARSLGLPTQRILFISDIPEELSAAEEVGMQVALSVRPGINLADTLKYRTLTNFNLLEA